MDHFRKRIFYESLGEYKEYDEILKSSWKVIKLGWERTKAVWSTFRNLKYLPKESAMLNKVIQGCDISVYAFPEADINAFVIPGFYVGVDKDNAKATEKLIKYYNKKGSYAYSYFEMILASQVEAVNQLKHYTINPSNRTVRFKTNKPVKISVFTTYGCLSHLTPQQRLGIYMHEVGHWVDTAKQIPALMLKHLDTERIFFYTHNIAIRYSTRYSELAADNFAKEVGYGKELKSALGTFGNIDTSGFSYMVRFNNWLMKSAIKADNDAEDSGNKYVGEYPSIKRRQEYLDS